MTIDDHFGAGFGYRLVISRQELRNWLAMLAVNGDIELPGIGREIRSDAPANWANAASGITFVSIFDGDNGQPGSIRYDEPGSMHPLQPAAISFYADAMPAASLDYLQDHCGRLIRLTGSPA